MGRPAIERAIMFVLAPGASQSTRSRRRLSHPAGPALNLHLLFPVFRGLIMNAEPHGTVRTNRTSLVNNGINYSPYRLPFFSHRLSQGFLLKLRQVQSDRPKTYGSKNNAIASDGCVQEDQDPRSSSSVVLFVSGFDIVVQIN